MHNLYAFPYQNVPQQWYVTHHRRQNALIVERPNGQIVNFKALRQVSYAAPIVIRMCDDNYLKVDENQSFSIRFALYRYRYVNWNLHRVLWPINIVTN